jgi:general secretion pathway protein G
MRASSKAVSSWPLNLTVGELIMDIFAVPGYLKRRRQGGQILKCRFFSLTEILVALAIIALLTAVVTPMYINYLRKAKVTTAKTQIKMLDQAILDYRLDMGKIPEAAAGLRALTENLSDDDKWDGPYLKRIPLDPWAHEYIYSVPGPNSEYEIKSYGSDGKPGGEKDAADITSNQ